MNSVKKQFVLSWLAVLALAISALLVDVQVMASAYVLDRLAAHEIEVGPPFVIAFRSITTVILILVPFLSLISAMCVVLGWEQRRFLVPATVMVHIMSSFSAGMAVVLYISQGWLEAL